MSRAAHGAIPPRAVWLAMAALSLGVVGAALVSQHRFDMQPCPWCILQRLIFVLIGAVCLLAAGLPSRGRVWRVVTGLLVVSLGVSGAAAALYQNQVAAKLPSCNLTLADRIVSGLGVDALWPDVFEVRASCADAAVALLGMPYELWSFSAFGLLVLVAGYQLRTESGRFARH